MLLAFKQGSLMKLLKKTSWHLCSSYDWCTQLIIYDNTHKLHVYLENWIYQQAIPQYIVCWFFSFLLIGCRLNFESGSKWTCYLHSKACSPVLKPPNLSVCREDKDSSSLLSCSTDIHSDTVVVIKHHQH